MLIPAIPPVPLPSNNLGKEAKRHSKVGTEIQVLGPTSADRFAPFSNCTDCTRASGVRQDWGSITIFASPFYMMHQDSGAPAARTNSPRPNFTTTLEVTSQIYCAVVCPSNIAMDMLSFSPL